MFQELGLSAPLLSSISKRGYTQPTPIQNRAIPVIRQGHDVIGVAKTGSGKTLAYVLPVLENLARDGHSQSPRALVIVPARELADQVGSVFHEHASEVGLKSAVFVGGDSRPRQLDTLSRGLDVAVGTAGRLRDLVSQGELKLDQVRILVIDEVDRVLEGNMLEDVEALVGTIPTDRQTILLSATLPSEVRQLARKLQNNPDLVKIDADLPTLIKHVGVEVRGRDLFLSLVKILQRERPECCFVFVNSREKTEEVSMKLRAFGIAAEAFSSDLDLTQRRGRLQRLRDHSTPVIVATDVLGRGIDIIDMDLVINYGMPPTTEAYTHRSGRTGRAGKEGRVISLVSRSEFQRMSIYLGRHGIQLDTMVLDVAPPHIPPIGGGVPVFSVCSIPEAVHARLVLFESALAELHNPDFRKQLKADFTSGVPKVYWNQVAPVQPCLLDRLTIHPSWAPGCELEMSRRVWRSVLADDSVSETWTGRVTEYSMRMFVRELLHSGAADRDILLCAVQSSSYRELWNAAIEKSCGAVPEYIAGGLHSALWASDDKVHEMVRPLIIAAELQGIRIVLQLRADTQMANIFCHLYESQDLSALKKICGKFAEETGWRVTLRPIHIENLPPNSDKLKKAILRHYYSGALPHILGARMISQGIATGSLQVVIDSCPESVDISRLERELQKFYTKIAFIMGDDPGAVFTPPPGTYFLRMRAARKRGGGPGGDVSDTNPRSS